MFINLYFIIISWPSDYVDPCTVFSVYKLLQCLFDLAVKHSCALGEEIKPVESSSTADVDITRWSSLFFPILPDDLFLPQGVSVPLRVP